MHFSFCSHSPELLVVVSSRAPLRYHFLFIFIYLSILFMPPIVVDPNLEPLPDFNGLAYQAIRDLIVTQVPNTTPAQAVEHLQAAYVVDRQTRIAAWDAQIQLEQEAEALRVQQLRVEEEVRAAEQEALAEAERKELEKKKPKINDFDENRMADSVIVPRPSPFAINKLKSFEYIELSYFTPEGCISAAEENKAAAEEAFGITKVDGLMALKPFTSFKASKNVIKDKDLSWRQMSMGKNSMLHHMNKLGWPEKHINALAHFYFILEDHPMRLRPDGDSILITFQAVVRREWHDVLDRNEGFNIAKINSETLRAVADEYHDKKRAEGLNEVSFSPLFPLHMHANLLPFSLSLSPSLRIPPYRLFYLRLTLHASCLVPRASCLMPHASCLMP